MQSRERPQSQPYCDVAPIISVHVSCTARVTFPSQSCVLRCSSFSPFVFKPFCDPRFSSYNTQSSNMRHPLSSLHNFKIDPRPMLNLNDTPILPVSKFKSSDASPNIAVEARTSTASKSRPRVPVPNEFWICCAYIPGQVYSVGPFCTPARAPTSYLASTCDSS